MMKKLLVLLIFLSFCMKGMAPVGGAASCEQGPILPKAKLLQLYAAVIRGSVESARALLSNNPELIATCDAQGNSLMWYAALYNRDKMIRFLHGRDSQLINLRNIEAKTALSAACDTDAYEAAQVLLELQPNLVDSKSKIGATPLATACFEGSERVASLLLEKAPHLINCATTRRNTPLILAAYSGKLSIVRMLIDGGADLHASNYFDDRTALDFIENAQGAEHLEIKRILRAAMQD